MQTFEVGVLPQSNFFFFSPTAQTQSLFYYQTMCSHFYCTEEYYIKRESVFASSSRLYQLLSLLDNPRRSPRLKKNDDSINRAIAYIRTHIGEKISLFRSLRFRRRSATQTAATSSPCSPSASAVRPRSSARKTG